jgi:hypothetical protein
MFSSEEMQEKARHIRDACADFIADHENATHFGNPCWGNRAGLLAYLAHNLGFSGARLEEGVEFMRQLCHEYDAHCKDMACRHSRN